MYVEIPGRKWCFKSDKNGNYVVLDKNGDKIGVYSFDLEQNDERMTRLLEIACGICELCW